MIAFAAFDSKILGSLQVVVDHAWANLPPDRRTIEIKDRVAKAVMRSAAEGERDQDRLEAIAEAAIVADPVDAYDIEVRRGDQTLCSLRSIELSNPDEVWGYIADLAEKVVGSECTIRVMDQSSRLLVSVGIETARLLRSV